MGFKDLIEAIAQVGFPVVVATYLVVFLTRIFGKLLERLDKIEKGIVELKEEVRKKGLVIYS